MKKRLRIAVIIILVLVLLVSAGGLIYEGVQRYERAQANKEAQELAGILDDYDRPTDPQPDPAPTDTEPSGSKAPAVVDPEPTATEEEREPPLTLQNMDLTQLKAINSDVIGWIHIPNTPISYPLVQGSNNDYYLNHTWRKTYNSGGAIFMEWQCSRNFTDFNTIIYGHRMNDSSMFNSLHRYADQSYWAAHPQVQIVTEAGIRTYDIFASMEVSVNDPVYWLISDQKVFKQSMIDFCLEASAINTGIVPTADDQFVTLSTCVRSSNDDYRWVVVAVLSGFTPADQ